MFDLSQPFADPARGGISEYDPVLHGWLDRKATQPFVPPMAVAAGIGGLLALGLAIAAAHEASRR